MSEDLINRAKELLDAIQYINVASVTPDGLPWNTPVYAKYDHALNFYWASWVHAQHSVNIRTRRDVFITLYDTTRRRGDNNRRCLYLTGTASELNDSSLIEPILGLLYGDEAQTMSVEEYAVTAIKRIYRFSPSAAWLNDLSERQVTGQTVKMRIEIPLTSLIKSLNEA